MSSSASLWRRSSALNLVSISAFLSRILFLLVSPASSPSSLSSQVYTVYTGESGNVWARSLNHPVLINIPWTKLAAMRARFIVDVEEDWSDLNSLGRIYNVWLYNFHYEDPYHVDPPSTDESSGSKRSNHINIEGPFRIQPHRYIDQIVLSINPYQPAWVQEQYPGKVLRTFQVIASPLFERAPFRLEQNIVGSEWIGSKPPGLESVILEHEIAWSMFCKVPDVDDEDENLEHEPWGVDLIFLYLMLRDDPDEVRRQHGQEIPALEGPWVVTPLNTTHRLVLFDGQDHPVWLSLHLQAHDDQYFRPAGPNNDVEFPKFADFVVLAPEDRPASAVAESDAELAAAAEAEAGAEAEVEVEAGAEAEAEVILNAYKYTCMRSTIEHWTQPIDTVQIHEVPTSSKVVIKNAAGINNPRNKYMVGKAQRHFPLAQSIRVSIRDRYAQQDRVIAQSVHTDHVTYDMRVGSDQKVAAQWLFAMICVLAGFGSGRDTSMSLRGT